MTAPPREPVRWTRRRWLITTGVLLVAHLGAISYFGERPHLLPRASRSRTALHLAVDPWSVKQIADLPTIDDPSLFALPSLHGFSGKAWLTFPRFEYPVRSWTEPPAYLALDADALGQSFAGTGGSNVIPVTTLAGKPAELLKIQISVPPLPVASASEFRIEGAAANRRLLEAMELPSWPSSDLLTNTVVQVLVDGEGNCVSAMLLASSGSKGADQFAVGRASAARFEPITQAGGAPGNATFGRMVFRWRTVSASETNGVPPNVSKYGR
jgi:TonB family protein